MSSVIIFKIEVSP